MKKRTIKNFLCKINKTNQSELAGRIRIIAGKKVSAIIGGPISGKLPNTFVRSIEEDLWKKEVSAYVSDLVRVSEPEIISYGFCHHAPVFFRRTKAVDARYIYSLKNVRVSPRTGLVWSDRFVFGESIGSLNKFMTFGRSLHEPLLKAKKVFGRVIPCGNHRYYHFFCETLPALIRVRKYAPDARILLSSHPFQYVQDSLELIFGSRWRDMCLFTDEPICPEAVVFASMHEHSGFITNADIGLLQESMPISSASSCSDRVYISRNKSPGRRIENETDIHCLFESHGYRVVYMEEHSLNEQIEIISSAAAVAGLHGAGLTNILFAKPGIKVVELFPPNVFNDCFARMSIQLEYDYNAVFLEPGKSNSSADMKKIMNDLSKLFVC